MPPAIPLPQAQPDAPAAPLDISALYRSEFPKLRRFLARRVRDAEDAAELAQDAFLRLVRIAPTTPIESPEAYLRRTAVNLLRDRAERASTQLQRLQVPIDDGRELAASEADPHRLLEARQQLEHHRALLQRLNPKTVEIFLLHRLDGLTYREIGERLGLSEGGVKKHMMKAIAHLARARGRDG